MPSYTCRTACLGLALTLAALPNVVAQQQDVVPVSVTLPKKTVISEELRLSGTLTAERSARLSPAVEGLVSRLRVDAGDRVAQGAPLLELDGALPQLAVQRSAGNTAEARARATEAQRLAVEAQRLVADRHLPQTELAKREADAKLAAAALTAAQAAEREQRELLRRHVLRAPFAGVVARRLTDVGEWVAPGTPVLELVAIDRVRLDVQAPQEQFARLTPDSTVLIYPATADKTAIRGRIAARVPVTDATVRTFLVRIVIDDAQGRLLPGTSATAVIQLPSRNSALTVPRDALTRYPDGSHSVFVIKKVANKLVATERKVTLGRSAAQTEVLKGLAADERVVIRGNETLRSGQAVRLVGGD
jgi:RND family efflux transporter MFP subunit